MDDRRRDALARRAVEWLVREREETGGWMLPAGMMAPGLRSKSSGARFGPWSTHASWPLRRLSSWRCKMSCGKG